MSAAVAASRGRARCDSGNVTLANPINDLPQYRAAMAKAGGDPVREVKASSVTRGMTLWNPDDQTWFVVARKPTTSSQPGSRLTYNRTMTWIPTEIDASGRVVGFWEVLADRDLIQRFPDWPGT